MRCGHEGEHSFLNTEKTGVPAFDVYDPDAMCDALLDLAVRVTKLEETLSKASEPPDPTRTTPDPSEGP